MERVINQLAGRVRELEERYAEALRADPELHVLIVGHADEDNTDAYNRALSRRRAAHVRDRILALCSDLPPERREALAARVTIEARGEWDKSDPGEDAQAKARDRRVELRFHYPRQCEPSFDAEFLACEWGRLPPPQPPSDPKAGDELAPPPADEPRAEAPRPSARARQDFRGPYVFGLLGYAVSSAEFLRSNVRWGVGAGYLWGIGSDFRVAAGFEFDHLVDAGFLFPQPDSCAPFCSEIDRSRLRLVPELRVGGARGGVWGWVRLSGGLTLQHREARRGFDMMGEVITLDRERWVPGGVVGIGPGVAIALTRHLFILIDATVSYLAIRGSGGGAGIYDAGAGLGWVF